jgi:hypothetical protein
MKKCARAKSGKNMLQPTKTSPHKLEASKNGPAKTVVWFLCSRGPVFSTIACKKLKYGVVSFFIEVEMAETYYTHQLPA